MFNEKCELSPGEECLRGSWTSYPLLSWRNWAGTASCSLKFLPSRFPLGTLKGKSKPCVSDSFTVNSSSCVWQEFLDISERAFGLVSFLCECVYVYVWCLLFL